MRLPVVSLAALLMLSDLAAARPGRYRRDTRAAAPRAAPTAHTPKPKPSEPPPLTADDLIGIEIALDDINEQLIEQHRALVDETEPDHPEMPDLLFRVAELTAQKQRYLRFRRMEAKDARARKRFAQRERRWLLTALADYKKLVDDPRYTGFERMDEAIFYYGYTLRSAGYQRQARQLFRRLVKDHPDSRFVPDAYASFADHYFETGDLDAAEKFYDKVLEFPKASVYPYALYKQGWVRLNRKRHEQALRTFYDVLELTAGDAKRRSLHGQARGAFVRAYAEVGKPKTAHQAFARVAPGHAGRMLEALGAIYLEHGEQAKAVYVYRELIGLEPDSARVCEWQYLVTEAVIAAGTPAQRAAELQRLVALYRRLARKRALPADALADCRDGAAAKTSEIARVWHNEAVKTRDPEMLALTAELYRSYLAGFESADDLAEMQFNLGELLWVRAEWEQNARLASERWQEAARQYTAVATRRAETDPKLRREAAYAATVAWKNALDVDPRTPPPPPPSETDAVPKPKPFPPLQREMLAAFERYRGLLRPGDRDYAEITFLEGRLRWRYHHHTEALPLLAEVLERAPDQPVAGDALVLLLDAHAQLHQYEAMIARIDRASNDRAFLDAHPGLAEQVDDSLVWALRRRAERLERAGDHLACGELYRTIWNKRPGAAGMDEVLYNAGVCYERGKSIGLAIRMRELLIDRFRDSNLAKRALIQIGNDYARIARYADAAANLERYARDYAGQEDAPDAMSYAVAYRKGLGQDDRAIADTEFFVRTYRKKRPDEAAEALFGMTAIYQKLGDDDALVRHLRRYLRELGKQGGIDRQIAAHAKIGEILWRRSCPIAEVDGACVRRQHIDQWRGRRGNERRFACASGDRFEVVARNSKLAAAARAELRAAVELWNGGKAKARIPGADSEDRERRIATAVHWVAAAEFLLAEPRYEEFLSLELPDVSSPKQLSKWKETKDALLLSAKKEYLEVVAIHGGGAHWAIAAAARVGLLYRTYADALLTAEIPAKLRRGRFADDMVDTYCDGLAALTDPLENDADEGFAFCSNEATKRTLRGSWAKLCERNLSRTGVVAHTPERHDDASAVSAIVTRHAPLAALENR